MGCNNEEILRQIARRPPACATLDFERSRQWLQLFDVEIRGCIRHAFPRWPLLYPLLRSASREYFERVGAELSAAAGMAADSADEWISLDSGVGDSLDAISLNEVDEEDDFESVDISMAEAVEEEPKPKERPLADEADSQRMMEECFGTEDQKNFFATMLEFLAKANLDVHRLVHPDLAQLPERRIAELVDIVPHIRDHLDIRRTIQYLCDYSPKMADTLAPMRTRLAKGRIDETEARRLLFRAVPCFGPNAVKHLLRPMWESEDSFKRRLVEALIPNYSVAYDRVLGVESRPSIQIVPLHEAVATALKLTPELQANHDPLERHRIDTLRRRAMHIDISKEVSLQLRAYQEELARGAQDGENTLICAPTNSGKTRVAIHIVRERFYAAMQQDNAKFKVAFLVPQKILVDQQHRVFVSALPYGDSMRIAKLAGVGGGTASAAPIAPTIKSSHIIVMTPQLLVNAMAARPQDETERVRISDFSLLIFDEAHHVNDLHPYNNIMNSYHDDWTSGVPLDQLPQIVGLTASIGVGKAQQVEEAFTHAAKICANLNVHRVNHVVENVAQLAEQLTNVKDEIVRCDEQGIETQPFLTLLDDQRRRLQESFLDSLKAEKYASVCSSAREKFNFPSMSNDFFSSLQQLRCDLTMLPQDDPNSTLAVQCAMQVLDHIQYNIVTETAARLIDVQTALEKYRTFLEEARRTKTNELTKAMAEDLLILQASAPNNARAPILEKLCSLIEELFVRNPESRCLVFAEKREQCQELAAALTRYLGKEAKHLTGATSAKDDSGLSAAQRASVMNAFRRGAYRILCATSVADEGLDVPECNLVVKYNMVGNEIKHVQRRGRGRGRDTRSLLLTLCQKTNERERRNMLWEQMMQNYLARIYACPVEFERQVNEQMDKHRQERAERRMVVERASESCEADRKRYQILCRKCSQRICDAKSIYSLDNHNVVLDPTIWDRVRRDVADAGEVLNFENALNFGHLQCRGRLDGEHAAKHPRGVLDPPMMPNECGAPLGAILYYKKSDATLPILKCAALVVYEMATGKRFIRSKWKSIVDNHFRVPAGKDRRADLAAMQAAGRKFVFNANVDSLISSNRATASTPIESLC